MSTAALTMTSPASGKRSYDATGLSYLGHLGHHDESLEVEPLKAGSSSSLNEQLGSSTQVPLLQSIETKTSTTTSLAPSLPAAFASEKPTKRPKLDASEKEGKRLDKEARDRQKADEKARKESEKARKDAEKTAKDEDRRRAKEAKDEQTKLKEEEKQKKEEERKKAKEAKDEQTRLKEEDKQKKEEEKMKKARSQLRLNAFFQQPSNPNLNVTGSPSKSESLGNGASPLSSRRSSVSELNMIESERRSRSVSIQRTPSKANLSDYQRYFPKFFLQSHTSLAPQNRFSHDSKGVLHVSKGIDEVLSKENNERHDLKQGLDSLRLSFRKVRRTPRIMSVKKAISSMTGSSSESIDETKMMPSKRSSDHMLQQIPIKFLKFAEDVRPPYIGTFSKDPTRGTISSLARNPLARVRPDTNYDYDSEAEWEDPIDGEDLNSEGEEEEEDEDEEEMEGFLDDEEPNAVRRRPMLGDQEPTCCGICWEGEARSSNGSMKPDSRAYRIDVLLENPCFPIDPYSTTYWASPQTEKSSNPRQQTTAIQTTLMEPPRVPLSPINRTNTLLKPPSSMVPPTTTNKAPKAPKRFVDPEILDDFKQAIVGSDLTKMGLCEILKKRFPKQKKDAIKDTLEAVAERVGDKAAEKKWVLKN